MHNFYKRKCRSIDNMYVPSMHIVHNCSIKATCRIWQIKKTTYIARNIHNKGKIFQKMNKWFSNCESRNKRELVYHEPKGLRRTSIHPSHAQSCPNFVTPWTVAHQVLLSKGFSSWEYWNGLPFPSPGDLPDPGIKPVSPGLLHHRWTPTAETLGDSNVAG